MRIATLLQSLRRVTLLLAFTSGVIAFSASPARAQEPASVEIWLVDDGGASQGRSALVAADGSVTVMAIVRDADGNPIDPSLYQLDITANPVGPTSGNAPVIQGRLVQFPKLPKRYLNCDTGVDPQCEFADADPADPNYGKETGGRYTVTATVEGTEISDQAQAVVLPTGTAKITARTNRYSNQLGVPLAALQAAADAHDEQAVAAAKAVLGQVWDDDDNSYMVLKVNQLMSPANAFPVTEAQLRTAGFTDGDDDVPHHDALVAMAQQLGVIRQRLAEVNLDDINHFDLQPLLNSIGNYQTLSNQFAALNPSAIGMTRNTADLDAVFTIELPQTLDLITKTADAAAARLMQRDPCDDDCWRLITTLFSGMTDTSGYLKSNIAQAGTSLANSMVGIILADLINRFAPPGVTIDVVVGSASLDVCCGDYPNSFVAGDGFVLNNRDRNSVTLLGCIDDSLVRALYRLNPNPMDLAAGIRLYFRILSIEKSTGRLSRSVAVLDNWIWASVMAVGRPVTVVRTPDELWAMEMRWPAGFPLVNQGSLPCAGVVLVFNFDTGAFRAHNVVFWPRSCHP